MKYIAPVEGSWGDYTAYFQYLETVRHQMPANIFEFANNPGNYDLISPESLHDSWLESWTISEPAAPDSRRYRSIQIEARFLGSKWDRYICLTYKGVGRHEVLSPEEFALPPTNKTGHGDLLVHEMRVVRDGLFAHELLFSRGSVFLVEFSEFEHRIELL